MSSPATTIRLNYEDFCALPEDGKRYEIIDGELYVTPAPFTKHQRISMNLSALLHAHVRAHRLGALFAAPFDVLLTDEDIVEPDLVFIANDRLHLLDERHLVGAPTLVIEILSESTRRKDLRLKHRLYAAHGVAEYWVIDPAIDTLQIYRHDGETLARVAELAEPDAAVTSPCFPGLELTLADVFA